MTKLAGFCIGMLFLFPAFAQAETWKIAVIEDWPPYASRQLGDQSLGIMTLRKALKRIGVQAKIEYYPWNRARYIAKTDDSYVGYYCAWPEEVVTGFFASVAIFRSPIGLISATENRLERGRWSTLKRLRFVMVKNYTYPIVFQNLAFKAQVSDDLALMKFVASGRAEVGVIDKQVFDYLANLHPDLKKTLTLHVSPAVNKPLVIAFRETDENRIRADLLAESGWDPVGVSPQTLN